MIKYTVIGYKEIVYKDKRTGEPRKAYIVMVSYEDKAVFGEAVNQFFVNAYLLDTIGGVQIGDEILIAENKGFVNGVYKI